MKKIYTTLLLFSQILFIGYLVFLCLISLEIISSEFIKENYSIIKYILLGIICVKILTIGFTIGIFLPELTDCVPNFYGIMGVLIGLMHIVEIITYIATAFSSNLYAFSF